MTTKAAPFKHKWLFALLWTNVAVALVDLIVFVGNPTRPTRDLLQSLAFTFVYANLTSILGVLILGWLIEKAAARKVSPWKIVIPGILVFVTGGCLLAQSLLAAAGFSASQHFWLDYYHTLRVAVPLALVFGLGAMTHAMLLSPRSGDGTATARKADRRGAIAKTRGGGAPAVARIVDSPPFPVQHAEFHQRAHRPRSRPRRADSGPPGHVAASLSRHQRELADPLAPGDRDRGKLSGHRACAPRRQTARARRSAG